jgi:hypothetical protein
VTVSEFQEHPGNESLLPAIPFQEKEEITKKNIRLVRRVGGHGHVISGQKLLPQESIVHWCIVMVIQPILVPQLFRVFSVDLLAQTR